MEQLEAMSLVELEAELRHALGVFNASGGKGAAARQVLKRVIWLEGERENLHGIPAPVRRAGS
jgi:hypothetical protein